VSIPSNTIPPDTIRETMPAYRLRANLRQAVLGALSARLRDHVNAPDRRALRRRIKTPCTNSGPAEPAIPCRPGKGWAACLPPPTDA